MPVRRWLAARWVRFVEDPLRDWLDRQPRDDAALSARLSSLEGDKDKLEKRLSMAMGALQAASAQIVQLRKDLEQAENIARQAAQQATSAFSMAESAAEGVHALEGEKGD
jgi:predicted  nucleic acid-binding Zn-ribbon protein